MSCAQYSCSELLQKLIQFDEERGRFDFFDKFSFQIEYQSNFCNRLALLPKH